MGSTKLQRVSSLARTDLVRAIDYVDNDMIKSQMYQSIRLITEALDDSSEFEKTWERWQSETANTGFYQLIPFNKMMER